jgi:transcriptional regulator with XRE-family HTH domain
VSELLQHDGNCRITSNHAGVEVVELMVAKKKTQADQAAQTLVVAEPIDAIAAELRKAREASGASFSDLHRVTGLSRTTLHQYEAGTRKPGAREIRLLCDALNTTPNRLIYGTEEPFKGKSRLHAMLDLSSEDLRTARLAMLLMMLSKDERDAWITLLGESIKARTGGGEKLDATLDAIEAATEVMASGMAEAIEAALPAQKIAELGQSIEAEIAARTESKAKNRRKAQK